ncbi:hypothetical protein F0562_017262 [Nyssa sinensis]|uniref:Uncharacterized protein n=1 Tax=Nyssa sinensis TaxID=561372 RepID=A0A5J4ZEH6_9ASTE|nr:hypothetical protein F0562_017262 [Nyssa sinensis]
MAEAIAFSILGKIAEILVEPIGRQFGYIFCYNSNIDSLVREVYDLKKMRLGVQMHVDAGKRNLEIVDPDVEFWLKQVDDMSEGAERIVQAIVEVEKGCLYGWCPNLKSRYSLCREAKKMKMEVVELQTNCKFDRMTYPAPPVTAAFKGLESRISITEEVLRALRDDTISMIGICGLGGVGKTTLVKEVAEKAKAQNLFDEVVMAVVSQNPDLTKIQRQLGQMLGLKYDGQNLLARAARLCARLTNGNRILVILDDVWERIDLGEVGIPLGGDRKGCKVVLTSRLQQVCSDMGTQKDFTVQVLSEEEAWDLFKEMAGHSVDIVDIHPIAKEVAQECGGLPIALVTLGRTLKNEEKHAWNDALQQLRSSETYIRGMQPNLDSSIELSYNYLESAQAKSLLLLCCLFPEDYNIWIEDLVRYVVGLRLFEDVETVAEARNRVYSVVDELRSCSLLLAGDEVFVQLYDVVRDVGIAIASKGEHLYLVRHDNNLEEWPEKERCEPCTAISLTSNIMHELPDGLDCPKLKLLQLASNSPSLNISEDFFGGMKDLIVIGFRDVRLKHLPPSLEFLMNLRTLCLHSCDFSTNISIIGSLTELEIFSHLESPIKELPREIGQLSKLKLLDLRTSDPFSRIEIPAGVLSNLSKLEELYIGRVNWKTEEFRENASITELNSLSCLKALEILIDAEVLPKDFCFQRLTRFRIGMGHNPYGFPLYQFQNSLTFGRLEMSMILETNVNVLLKTTEILIFDQVKGMKNVLMELDVEGFEKLKELWIGHCDEVEYLIDVMDLVPDSAFVSLESMDLKNMHNLKEICNGNPPVGFLSRLQRLMLQDLPAMKSLWWASIQPECLGNLGFLCINQVKTIKSVFTESIVKGLVQLQQLSIGFCDVEEIVAMEGGEDDQGAEKIEFPNLNILELEELPNLRSFYPKSDIGAIPSLFNQKVILRSMERLDVRGLNKLVQIVDNEQMQTDSFHKIRILEVDNCEKLINIASSDQIKVFNNLEKLEVRNCRTLEVVFDFQGLKVNQEHAEVALGQQRSLALKDLPKLTHVWRMVPKGIHGLQNLRSLEVVKCDNLRYLLSISTAKLLVKLQELKLERCEMMEEVIETEKEEEEAKEMILFPELNSITLRDLKNLERFVFGSYTSNWNSLKILYVLDCPKLKAFHLESQSVQKVKTIDGRKSEKQQENNFHIPTLTHFFNEKVILPSMEILGVRGLNNLVQIVDNEQMQTDSFHKLRILEVDNCEKLINIASSDQIKVFNNLEKLEVRNCRTLEVVFDFQGLKVNQEHAEVALGQQRSLALKDLPKLTHVWRMVPKGIHGLQNLRSLEVVKCDNLRYLLSISTAKLLVKLQELKLERCEMMEEVIETEKEEEEAREVILFPELNYIILKDLKNLERFISGSYTFKWNSLKELHVVNCDNLRYLLSISTAKLLVTLQYLRLEMCEMMEEVIETEKEEEEAKEVILFPELNFIILKDLKNLESFVSGSYTFKLREQLSYTDSKTFLQRKGSIP